MEGSEAKYPSSASGGEQQRVSLARGIVTNPKVLLLTSPSAIDAKLRKALQNPHQNIHTSLGITTIFVTHDQEEAMRMSDRIYLMNAGRVEQSGSPWSSTFPQRPTTRPASSAITISSRGNFGLSLALTSGSQWQLCRAPREHLPFRYPSFPRTIHPGRRGQAGDLSRQRHPLHSRSAAVGCGPTL